MSNYISIHDEEPRTKSVFGATHDKLAKANSKEYMKDVHPEARRKNKPKIKKSKVNSGPLPMGYGFDMRSGPVLPCHWDL